MGKHLTIKSRLQNYRDENKAKWEILEQDYALSWMLAGISLVPELRDSLVFKGGTCLRKCYFGDYRFSQDIDLTVRSNHADLSLHLGDYMAKACRTAESLIQNMGENFRLSIQPYREKNPHPEGQLAFSIQAHFPWQREPLTTIYVEVSFAERVLLPVKDRKIIHPYGEDFSYVLSAYDLNEVVAEKIRALLQFAKKLHERGWGRSRVRDYYDLWRILDQYEASIDKTILPSITRTKCLDKGIILQDIDDLFSNKLVANAREEWSLWLQGIVTLPLPEVDFVLKIVRNKLINIFE